MKLFRNYAVVVLLLINSAFGWGDKGHKLIAISAMKYLPAEMHIPTSWNADIEEHSVDADTRKGDVKAEGPRHFIDIDYYSEYSDGKKILSRDELAAKYGKEMVEKQGVLPWATVEVFDNLVESFKSGDNTKIKYYMSDLAHYVADAHQPMHTILNYNGQLTGQKGVHARYEIFMVDSNFSYIESHIRKSTVEPIHDIQSCIFDVIRESNTYQTVLMSADKLSSDKTKGVFNQEYYKLMWFYTEFVTMDRLDKAASRLANIYYLAWEKAGKPTIK